MNLNEAKLILSVALPGDDGAADPQLAEALALARRDAELGAWWERECRWDAEVRRSLATVAVPSALPSQILAGQKVVRLPKADAKLSNFEWSTPLFWGLAAALVVFLSLAASWLHAKSDNNLASFARDMMAMAPDDSRHVDVRQADLAKVKGWLAEHHGPADLALPVMMQRSPDLMGCRVLQWHGQAISMLCYMMPGAQHVDLFVIRAAGLKDVPAPGQRVFASIKQNAMAAWQSGGNVYLLAGAVPMEFLHLYVEPSQTTQTSWPAPFAGVIFYR